jgi:hypothetical protein
MTNQRKRRGGGGGGGGKRTSKKKRRNEKCEAEPLEENKMSFKSKCSTL